MHAEWFRQLSREGPDARYWLERIQRGDESFFMFLKVHSSVDAVRNEFVSPKAF